MDKKGFGVLSLVVVGVIAFVVGITLAGGSALFSPGFDSQDAGEKKESGGTESLRSPVCGNGVFEPGEQCEDCGNDYDSCSSECKFEYCGDGIMQPEGRHSEVCDGFDGCSKGEEICNPETCSECLQDPLGEAPVVNVVATPPRVQGDETVRFSVTAQDPDSLLASYKLCLIDASNGFECRGGGGGEGCAPDVEISPTSIHSFDYERRYTGNPNDVSRTSVVKVIYKDQEGNIGFGTVVIPIYAE